MSALLWECKDLAQCAWPLLRHLLKQSPTLRFPLECVKINSRISSCLPLSPGWPVRRPCTRNFKPSNLGPSLPQPLRKGSVICVSSALEISRLLHKTFYGSAWDEQGLSRVSFRCCVAEGSRPGAPRGASVSSDWSSVVSSGLALKTYSGCQF